MPYTYMQYYRLIKYSEDNMNRNKIHCIRKLQEREIKIKYSTLEKLASHCTTKDTALLLGNSYWNGEKQVIILIVRDRCPVTIMYRRAAQIIDKKTLQVDIKIDLRR